MAKKVKQKKCAYSECGKLFTPTFSTLQIVCSLQCSIAYNSEREIKKRVAKMKVEVEGTTQLEKAARIIFQKWIRERDKNLPCISCGTYVANQFDGSHYHKAEIYSGLIFNEMNVHKSCSYCNKELAGNLVNYRIGLVKRYGEDYAKQLDEMAVTGRKYTYTRSQLIDIANKYKMKLKNGDFTSDNPSNI